MYTQQHRAVQSLVIMPNYLKILGEGGTWPAAKREGSGSEGTESCVVAHSCTMLNPCTKHCGVPEPSSAAHSVSSWPLRRTCMC